MSHGGIRHRAGRTGHVDANTIPPDHRDLHGLPPSGSCPCGCLQDRQMEKKRPIRAASIPRSILGIFARYVPLQIENLTIQFDIRNLFDETCAARGPDGTGMLGVAAALMNRGAR